MAARPPSGRGMQRQMKYRDGYEAQDGTMIRYQHDWTKQHQLEGDGLLPLLYDHMWKSDKTKEHRLKCAWIPDTVLYEHNFPRAWYTYDIKTNELVKRAGKFLDAQTIYQHFSAEEGTDIVAQFYYSKTVKKATPSTSMPLLAKSRSAKSEAEDDEMATAVEFFTKATLFEFLHNRKTRPDGVLQKFLLPKGKAASRSNFQIQAVWSPRVTLVYKRTNKRRLNDKSVSVDERAATFDGPPHLSTESLVASSTKESIRSVCKAVVDHFSVTEHKPVVRIVMYFKIDDKDRLWVLWASSLRIGADKLNAVHTRVPLHLALRVSSGGQSHTEGGSQNPKTEKRLFENDVALYDMTGDWIFARTKCGGRSPSPERDRSPERVRAIADRPNSARVPRPPSGHPYDDEETGARTHRPHYTHPAFISPRAPFLATTAPHQHVPVESPRHPLHERYMELAEPENEKQREHDANAATRRRYKSFHYHKLSEQEFKKPLPLSQAQKIQKFLVQASQDMVYDVYSQSLQITPDASAPHISLDVPKEVRDALTPAQFDDLIKAMQLRPEELASGETVYIFSDTHALARGRRKDRPVAQVNREVEDVIAAAVEANDARLLTVLPLL